MKKICFPAPICPLLFVVVFAMSCHAQPDSNALKNVEPLPQNGPQIDEYVVKLFEDSKGSLWFGTLSSGVARYDGKTLTYFSEKDGLVGNAVVSIVEDKAGNMWFGTHSGLSKYDGKQFTNFTEKDGLCDDRVANLLIDRVGNFWVGTWDGVCRLEGGKFVKFLLPVPDVELFPFQTTMNWVAEITEDSRGNIWFGRDGYGACKYDGRTFVHFTKRDGLPSNNVQDIQEDKQGNIWFGTRVAENDSPDPLGRAGNGGLCRYDGKKCTQFPDLEGLSRNEIYSIYPDRAGNIWIGATRVGVYRYDGQSFRIFKGTDRMDLTANFGVQDILEDRNGTIWFGFSGGLFRLAGSSIVNVTQYGPWK